MLVNDVCKLKDLNLRRQFLFIGMESIVPGSKFVIIALGVYLPQLTKLY